MELRQLRYFIAVAERLSYSKAAKELHVSVSPLSRQIQQLEDEFGLRLFVRDRRHVKLTDAGKIFLEDAKVLINQTASLFDRLRQAKNGEAGVVRIGVGMHLGENVSKVVVEHLKRHPAVDVEGTSIFSTLQNAALLEGRIDVGFLRGPVDTARLNSELLYEEKLLVVMSKANPLSRKKSLRVKELSGETLFLPDRNLSRGLHDLTLALYERAGISPKISPLKADPVVAGDIHKVLLAANKGIFIIADEMATRTENGSAALAVPLKDPDAKLEVQVAWRKDETRRTIFALLDTARKVIGRAPTLAIEAVRPALTRVQRPSLAPTAALQEPPDGHTS
jgi:LysR family transcriptional regulator, benzoate and cis,cis-muconate-responsive activator of ben and cat genes